MNSENDALLSRTLTKLRQGDALQRLADIAIDSAFSRPVSSFVSPERVVELVRATIDEERIARMLRDVIRPSIERRKAALVRDGEPLSSWLPADAAAILDELLRGVRPPTGAWAKSTIDPRDIRELVSPVLEDALLAFARRLPLVSGAKEDGSRAGKLLTELAKGIAHNAGAQAQKFASIGKGVLGGLGAEIEKRLGTSAKEFADAALEPISESLRARLESEEGRAIVARIRARILDRLLAAKAGELATDLDAFRPEALERLIAKTVAHDVARPEVQNAIAEEVSAFFALFGERRLGDVLDEWSMRNVVREEAKRQLLALAKPALDTPSFETWLRELLSSAE